MKTFASNVRPLIGRFRLFVLLLAFAAMVQGSFADSKDEKKNPRKKPKAEAAKTVTNDKPTSPTHSDPRVVQILDAFHKKYADVHAISGEFDQVKRSEVFLEDTRSQGKFWHLKPDLFRCDYLPPYKSINLIVDNIAYLALPDIRQVEKYVFDDSQKSRRHVHQLLLGFGIATSELLQSYEISLMEEETKGDIVALRFKPRGEDDTGIDSIGIWLRKDKLQPSKLLIEEGEDETRIEIREIDLNPSIDPAKFDPAKVLDKDWEVIDKL